MVQDAWAAFIDAPVTVIVLPPAAAATTAVPLGHELAMAGVPATTTPAGSVSVKLMPASAGLPVPLVSVKVSVEIPPASIAVGPNAFDSVGCTTVTVCGVTPFVMPEIAVMDAASLVFA